MKHFEWSYGGGMYWIYPLPRHSGVYQNNLEFKMTENFENEMLVRRVVQPLDYLMENIKEA